MWYELQAGFLLLRTTFAISADVRGIDPRPLTWREGAGFPSLPWRGSVRRSGTTWIDTIHPERPDRDAHPFLRVPARRGRGFPRRSSFLPPTSGLVIAHRPTAQAAPPGLNSGINLLS
ncbi:MAG: hypothetical protein ACLQGP_12840 [Isosphaeraceae bacterium]